ncbi:MAG: lamin tail domain-containing protein [Candidatus Eisenbacteria bacterium]|nr:lamin tail domain-containing protein [Candidatus Eisenbacteria bacterium]
MRFVLLVLFGCVALGGYAGPASCGPVLNEVMADPARDWDGSGAYNYRDDEWVEIYNPGPGTLTLDGYLIGDGDGSPLYGFTGTLAAGGHRVVYGSAAVVYQQAHGLGVYGLRLGNDGDTVTLLQVVGSDTLLIDSRSYNTYEAEDDRSSGRSPDGSSTWEIFDSLNPYGGSTPPLGNGLPPTPGQANGAPAVAAVSTTWGHVRAIYR